VCRFNYRRYIKRLAQWERRGLIHMDTPLEDMITVHKDRSGKPVAYVIRGTTIYLNSNGNGNGAVHGSEWGEFTVDINFATITQYAFKYISAKLRTLRIV